VAEIIQSMWVGPRLTAMEQLCIKSYLHHGHEFHLYVYQDTAEVPDGTTIMDGNKIIDESKIFVYEGPGFGHKSLAGFADKFRYRLLLEKGNWWVDTDSVCLKPFDFATDYVFSSEDPCVGDHILSNINCGNLKAPAGCELYQWLVEKSENVDVKMRWGTIGPALMKRAVQKVFNLQEFVQHPKVFCPVRYDFHCVPLLDPSKRIGFGSESYAVHLWNEAWRAHNIDKDGRYDPLCLYEILKAYHGVVGSGPFIKFAPPPVPVRQPPAPPSSIHHARAIVGQAPPGHNPGPILIPGPPRRVFPRPVVTSTGPTRAPQPPLQLPKTPPEPLREPMPMIPGHPVACPCINCRVARSRRIRR